MNLEIMVLHAGKRCGPFPVAEVRVRFAQGVFLPDDLGWYEGMSEWAPLARIPEINPHAWDMPTMDKQTAISSNRPNLIAKIGYIAAALLIVILLFAALLLVLPNLFKVGMPFKQPMSAHEKLSVPAQKKEASPSTIAPSPSPESESSEAILTAYGISLAQGQGGPFAVVSLSVKTNELKASPEKYEKLLIQKLKKTKEGETGKYIIDMDNTCVIDPADFQIEFKDGDIVPGSLVCRPATGGSFTLSTDILFFYLSDPIPPQVHFGVAVATRRQPAWIYFKNAHRVPIPNTIAMPKPDALLNRDGGPNEYLTLDGDLETNQDPDLNTKNKLTYNPKQRIISGEWLWQIQGMQSDGTIQFTAQGVLLTPWWMGTWEYMGEGRFSISRPDGWEAKIQLDAEGKTFSGSDKDGKAIRGSRP
jgi:hypothetical protein